MTRGSLRLRLLLAGAFSVILALALAGVGLTLLFQRHVERWVAAELDVQLNQVIAGLDRVSDGALEMAKPPGDPRFAKPLSGLYWQVQVGELVLRSRSLWDTQLEVPDDQAVSGAVVRRHIRGPDGSELIASMRTLALPARLGGGTMRAVVAIDAADIATATRAFTIDLLPYLTLIAAFLIAAAYAQVAIGLRPLAVVRDRLAAIRAGRASRLGRGFPGEIVPLAEEVDALLTAREAQVAKARARAADLAHGLKTPLQVIAGDVERLRSAGERAIAEEIEQVAMAMRRHVDRELARARTAAAGSNARCRVAEVVERVVAVIMRTPEGGRIEWSIEIGPELAARIDADDLAEAVGNLAENAARHAHGAVTIRGSHAGGFISIAVADDGPGIPADQLDAVLVRGGRLDQSGSGAGLGLAIVSDIAEAWDGDLELRSEGSGLVALLRLPVGEA